jgi:hypothetical protein
VTPWTRHSRAASPAGLGGRLFGREVPALAADEALGGLDESADRSPLGVTDDLAALRVGRGRGDLRELHGLGVDQARVAAGVGEHDRVRGRDLAQGVMERQALDVGHGRPVPLVLVPAPAADPFPGLGRPGRLGDEGHDLVPRAGLGQVEDGQGLAEAGEVAVALDEARDGERTAEVDDLRRVADVGRVALGLGAERGDAVAPDREPGRGGDPVVDGDDLPVDEDEVGRLGRLPDPAIDDEQDREHGDDDDEESQSAVSRGHGLSLRNDSVLPLKLYLPGGSVNPGLRGAPVPA